MSTTITLTLPVESTTAKPPNLGIMTSLGAAEGLIPSVARAVAQRNNSSVSSISNSANVSDANGPRPAVYRNDPYCQGPAFSHQPQPLRQPSAYLPPASPVGHPPQAFTHVPFDYRMPGRGQAPSLLPPSQPPPPSYGDAEACAQPYMFYNGSYDVDAAAYQGWEGESQGSLACYRPSGAWDETAECAPNMRVADLTSCVAISVHPRRRNSTNAVGGCLGQIGEHYTTDASDAGDVFVPADDRWDIDDCESTAGQVCFRNRWAPASGCLPFDVARGSEPPGDAPSLSQSHGGAQRPGKDPHPSRESVPLAQFDSCLLVADSAEVTHSDLNGFCRYLPFPAPADVARCVAEILAPVQRPETGPSCSGAPPSSSGRNLPIFFGQVLFSTTREQLTWLIFTLTGVATSIVTNHSPGCFTCYFKTNDECAAVLQLNKRVLFDRSGVWIADTAEQAQLLYVTALSQTGNHPSANGGCRLPKGPLVVEVPMHKGMSSLPRRGPLAQPEYRQGGGPRGPNTYGAASGRPKAKTTQRMA